MKNFFLPLLLWVAIASDGIAGGPFAVSGIPAALLKNADAVLRTEEMRFEIISQKETVETYHWVVTVINQNGDKWARFYEYYDRLRSLSGMEGFLYDASGNLMRKARSKDFEDVSAVDRSSLIDDNRARRHDFYCKSYPYTVEYRVVIRYSHTFYFPDWMPQWGERIAVEKSQAQIVCPEGYQFRFKALRYNGEPIVSSDGKKKTSSWSVQSLPAIVREPYQPPLQECTTVVYFGPTDFSLGPYNGNMQTWQGFGQFINELKKGRDQLPEATRQQVRSLVSGIADTATRVRVLYEFLQKNTRYISIQLGIGGWQPLDANFVATHAYGDCKALTNYMYSLLREAGIPAAYTLIYAGSQSMGLDPGFPDNRFNHVILAVPLAGDTIWLECTSQTIPAGYLGGFTGDRYALMIDEAGGKVVRTPRYQVEQNLRIRKVSADLAGPDLQVRVNTTYTGMQQDYLHGFINNLSRDYIRQYLDEQFDFPSYTINSFDYQQDNRALPAIRESLDLTIPAYATLAGKRILLMPNLMSRTEMRVPADSNRSYDVVSALNYRDIDSVEIGIPTGYMAESVPADLSLESVFGKFRISVRVEGNRIHFYRMLERYSGRMPPSRYAELARFNEQVYRADRNKIVLVKSE